MVELRVAFECSLLHFFLAVYFLFVCCAETELGGNSLNLLRTVSFFWLLCVLYATIILWLGFAWVFHVSLSTDASFSVDSPLYVRVNIVGGLASVVRVWGVLSFYRASFRRVSRVFFS